MSPMYTRRAAILPKTTWNIPVLDRALRLGHRRELAVYAMEGPPDSHLSEIGYQICRKHIDQGRECLHVQIARTAHDRLLNAYALREESKFLHRSLNVAEEALQLSVGLILDIHHMIDLIVIEGLNWIRSEDYHWSKRERKSLDNARLIDSLTFDQYQYDVPRRFVVTLRQLLRRIANPPILLLLLEGEASGMRKRRQKLGPIHAKGLYSQANKMLQVRSRLDGLASTREGSSATYEAAAYELRITPRNRSGGRRGDDYLVKFIPGKGIQDEYINIPLTPHQSHGRR